MMPVKQAAELFIEAWIENVSMWAYVRGAFDLCEQPRDFKSIHDAYSWMPSHASWYGPRVTVREFVDTMYPDIGDRLYMPPMSNTFSRNRFASIDFTGDIMACVAGPRGNETLIMPDVVKLAIGTLPTFKRRTIK